MLLSKLKNQTGVHGSKHTHPETWIYHYVLTLEYDGDNSIANFTVVFLQLPPNLILVVMKSLR